MFFKKALNLIKKSKTTKSESEMLTEFFDNCVKQFEEEVDIKTVKEFTKKQTNRKIVDDFYNEDKILFDKKQYIEEIKENFSDDLRKIKKI